MVFFPLTADGSQGALPMACSRLCGPSQAPSNPLVMAFPPGVIAL
jgi:hypothetical protein